MAPIERPLGRVHVVGAGPVGLFLTALLQSIDGQAVRLYERRAEYTRTRMVSLADVPRRRLDRELQGGRDRRPERRGHLRPDRARDAAGLPAHRSPRTCARCSHEWTRGFVPLNTIERSLSELIDARDTGTVERIAGEVDAERGARDAGARRHPRRLHRAAVADARPPAPRRRPGRRAAGTRTRFRLEYALVVTFLYDQHYACNEYCKYYKNVENADYKFIPAVHRTYYDGSVSHVTGIVGISEAEFEAMPPSFDGAWLREHFPSVAQSMDRFIDKIRDETHGELVGDLEIVRIPLDLYHARNATSRRWHGSGIDHPLATAPVFLLGDSAIGSPYFQSISLGLECAFFLAGHIANRSLSVDEMFERYEAFMYQQWLRVYMRTQMIKHNKDLLESVDDTLGLLAKLHVF